MLIVMMALAGGLGAVARFVADGWIKHHWRTRFPVGTLMINVLGSYALGLLVGLNATGTIGAGWVLVLGAGLLGGFTTMSTASVEVVRLLRLGARVTAVGHLLGGAALCLVAGLGGYLLGH